MFSTGGTPGVMVTETLPEINPRSLMELFEKVNTEDGLESIKRNKLKNVQMKYIFKDVNIFGGRFVPEMKNAGESEDLCMALFVVQVFLRFPVSAAFLHIGKFTATKAYTNCSYNNYSQIQKIVAKQISGQLLNFEHLDSRYVCNLKKVI